MKQFSILAASILLVISAAAADPVIEDLAFLEGTWRGEAGEMVHEDMWTGPEAGIIVGLFKLRTGDKFNISEFLIVTQEETRVVMRFKHFRADFTTWESADEPITLFLTHAGDNEALFEPDNEETGVRSLSFKINGDGEMVSAVVVKKGAPETGVDEFSFTSQRR